MRKIFLFILLTAISNLVSGQTYYEKFKTLFQQNDTIKIASLLTEWEKMSPNDPELYTAAINYYFSNSKKEIVSVDKQQKSNEKFSVNRQYRSGCRLYKLISGLRYRKIK